MNVRSGSCLLLSMVAGVLATARAQPISDVVPPLVVRAGVPDTIVVSDLFYARSYGIQFRSNDRVRVSYDARNGTATFEAARGYLGATVVDFTVGKDTCAMLVYVRNERSGGVPHVFRVAPAGPARTVFVAGTFNNWSRSADELNDPKGSGTYERTISLDPGTYLYKFVIDGKEIVDPANPERSPTGFDDFNSILRINDPDTSKLFLHVDGITSSQNSVTLSFVVEQTGAGGPPRSGEVLALIDNRRIDDSNVSVQGDAVRITLRRNELAGTRVVRLLVVRGGRCSNLQQVVLRDGSPAGGKGWQTWSDGIMYSMMIDRFNDGDPSNDKPVVHDSLFVQANYQGGDLRGIIRKIEDGYFDSLGVNILWVSPVYDNPDVAFREYPPPHRWYSGYHGYWPVSDTLVEEKFGTMADLQELVSKAHAHGLRVLLDFVAHHVHIDHPSFKSHPDWFGTLELPDGRKNLRLWDEFRLSTWFEPYMPSYDFTRSAEAVNAVSENAVWWLGETGADGFRHDAVKHVPNTFWRTLTRRLKEEIEIPRGRDIYQIGETFGDDGLISSYVNNGQLDAQFNFNLSYLAIPVFLDPEKSFTTLDYYLKRSFDAYGPYNLMGNIMDSHDKVRFMAYADGDVKQQGTDTREMAWTAPPTVDHPSSYHKAELYLAYMLTTPGIPVIYYGSEFGMTGADDPDNRRMMRFDGGLTGPEHQMLGVTSSLVRLRRLHPALRYGDFLTLGADERTYSYLRSDMNERVLVVLNKSDEPCRVTLHLPAAYVTRRLVDLLAGGVQHVVQGTASVDVPAIGFRVFRVE